MPDSGTGLRSGGPRPAATNSPRERRSGSAAPDVVIVGGGVIGLAIAWGLGAAGLTVTVADPAPGSGASFAAAGFLTPAMEYEFGQDHLLRLNRASTDRYPSFAGELSELTGMPSGYRPSGTVAAAFDNDDRAVLRDLLEFHHRLGLRSEWLSGRECRRLEPMLAPSVHGGLLVEDDHSVDNRVLTHALIAALGRVGVPLVRERVTDIIVEGGRATGVRLGGGDITPAGTIVLAAGCWSGEIAGLPEDAVPPVRPVKGQILRLRVPEPLRPFLRRCVRGTIRGAGVYLVPRDDGELVVGATSEEMGYDTQVTAGGVYELLRDAHHLVPGITELTLVETIAGLRPGTPDNAPILGPTRIPGLVLATGHYRSGIMLTPITADAIRDLLVTGELPEVARPFAPARFMTEELIT